MDTSAVTLWMLLTYIMIAEGAIVDMSYSLGPNSTTYPGNPPFNLSALQRGEIDIGGNTFWLEYNWYATYEHMSTHMDAPVHFFKTGLHIDEIPIENLMGPGIVLNAVDEAKNNSDFLITKDFIVKWEEKNGIIPKKAMVLLNFGWGVRFADYDNTLIFGTQTWENISTYHFPGIAADGMEFLITERKINVVGTDTPSIDYGQTTIYSSHVVCARNNVGILENVANLDKLPTTGSQVFAVPLKLQGGSGSACRVFAIVNEQPPPCKPNPTNSASTFLIPYTLILFISNLINCI